MSRSLEAPIIVSGLGRSGTTWMQWFLSQHPRIHIHGQSPNVPWPTYWGWFQTLVEQGEWSRRANMQVGYKIAHYAGSNGDRARKIFKQTFRRYMTGFGPKKPRWGLKWIDLAANPAAVSQWESLWPETRWVICLRDPFLTLSSARNTFVPSLDLCRFATSWVAVCRFIESHDAGRVALVQMDKLKNQTADQRKAAMDEALARVGEAPCRQTDDFVRRWPIVHKVKPDETRQFVLSDDDKRMLLDEVPELGDYMQRMGYGPGAGSTQP